MCGINGIFNFRISPSLTEEADHLKKQIELMNDAIRHRGPDGEGIFIQGAIGLGHRRLSIIDLSDLAAQPFMDRDNDLVIVFNGEIYNYIELRSALKGKHHFITESDTEVVLKAYLEYGDDCVNLFNGMWSFAIFDVRKNKLFASRDRLGVKPFYYTADAERFIFSSEIKAIRAVKSINSSDHEKVYDYLALGNKRNDGKTLFAGVLELKAGHNLILEENSISIHQYWDIFKVPTPDAGCLLDLDNPKTIQSYLDQLSYLLTDAISLRFRSDVPVGILLSGGVDSSTIAVITNQLVKQGHLGIQKVKAFSALFPGSEYNEEKNIQILKKGLSNIEVVEVYPDSEFLSDNIVKVIDAMGEPFFSTTVFAHNALLQEIRKQNFKVVLNGQGADEAFCGYDKYDVGYFLLDIFLAKPSEFLKQFHAFKGLKAYTISFLISRIAKSILKRETASQIRAKYLEKSLAYLDHGFMIKNKGTFANYYYSSYKPVNLVNYQKSSLGYEEFNRILHYEDHSAMQHSVEIRSPFIDYRLIEFGLQLPLNLKINRGHTKYIIRKLMSELIPESVIWDHLKIGFATPFNDWLQQDRFRQLVMDCFNSSSFLSMKTIRTEKLRNNLPGLMESKSFPLWRFINLALWAEINKISNL
jgi:asparagine synthase (glutamine-hydrolysing)